MQYTALIYAIWLKQTINNTWMEKNLISCIYGIKQEHTVYMDDASGSTKVGTFHCLSTRWKHLNLLWNEV